MDAYERTTRVIRPMGDILARLGQQGRLQDLSGEVISLSTVHDGKAFEGDLFAISLSEIESAQNIKDKIVKRLIEL